MKNKTIILTFLLFACLSNLSIATVHIDTLNKQNINKTWQNIPYNLEIDYLLKKLLNGNENPENGVYIKYTKDRKKAYIFIDEDSKHFSRYKGVIAVDISNKRRPFIIMYSTTVYSNPSDFYFTDNGNILVFTYTNTNQYMGTINLNTLTLVDSVMITMSGINSWCNLYKTNTHFDLFYTIHSTPEQGLFTYYHVSNVGDIIKISGIDAGGRDSHYIWGQEPIDNDKYSITYLDERVIGNIRYLKYTKKIYDITNLPDMPLIDTIITEEEQPI